MSRPQANRANVKQFGAIRAAKAVFVADKHDLAATFPVRSRAGNHNRVSGLADDDLPRTESLVTEIAARILQHGADLDHPCLRIGSGADPIESPVDGLFTAIGLEADFLTACQPFDLLQRDT